VLRTSLPKWRNSGLLVATTVGGYYTGTRSGSVGTVLVLVLLVLPVVQCTGNSDSSYVTVLVLGLVLLLGMNWY
jgi:hypothetical protein